jgi:hypothetical protein
MERLFSPCNRLRDLLDEEDVEEYGDLLEGLQELNLNVSTEELLSAERAFTYFDLYAVFGNRGTLLWLTPHAFVARKGEAVVDSWMDLEVWLRFFCFNADGIKSGCHESLLCAFIGDWRCCSSIVGSERR